MEYIVGCVILFSLPIQSSCNSYLQRDKASDKINRDVIKCLNTFIANTDWAVNDFAVIYDDVDMIEFDSFKGRENFTWTLVNSNVNSTSLSGFLNVILFASSFESLKQITGRINIRPMDTRSKYVITVMENFRDFNDIRKASIGIGPAMWKLDKTRVVFLVPHMEEILAMTYFPFAKDCEPGELEVLDVWREGEFEKGVELFPEKMIDVRGCVQNHTALDDRATSLQGRKILTKKGESVLGGVGGEFMAIVAQKMNMKLHLLPEEPNHWLIIMDTIARGDSLFWLATNTPVPCQLEFLDIGSGYMEESLGFGYLTEGYEVPWENLIWPLSRPVWLYTGYTFVLFCGLVFATTRICRWKMINSHDLRLLDIFGVFLGSSRALPRTVSGRYLLGIWVLYSYLITASYNCGLVSFLTTPIEKRVINTLAELLEDGMDFGGGKFHREVYNDPSDPVMMKIYDKFKLWSLKEAARIVDDRKGATGFFSSSLYSYNRNRTDVNDRIHLLKEKAFVFQVPITMRRGSPFTIGVRRYASRAMNAGLNNYLFNHYIRNSRLGEIDKKTPRPILIRHIRGILYLHVAILSLSCLIFFGEIIFHKYSPSFRSSFSISVSIALFFLRSKQNNSSDH